jgi:hypothetical protein
MELTQIIYNERRQTVRRIISYWFLNKLTDKFITYWKSTINYFIYSVTTDIYSTNQNIIEVLKQYSNDYNLVKNLIQEYIDEFNESTTIYNMDNTTYNIIQEIVNMFNYEIYHDKTILIGEILIELASNFIVKNTMFIQNEMSIDYL